MPRNDQAVRQLGIMQKLEAALVTCVPRASGDEPYAKALTIAETMVFPASAGMNEDRPAPRGGVPSESFTQISQVKHYGLMNR